MTTLSRDQYFGKDPDVVTYFTVDWADDVRPGEAVESATWIVPAGLTKLAEGLLQTIATVWLSGGTDGQSYECTCRATYDSGRSEDWTILVECRHS